MKTMHNVLLAASLAFAAPFAFDAQATESNQGGANKLTIDIKDISCSEDGIKVEVKVCKLQNNKEAKVKVTALVKAVCVEKYGYGEKEVEFEKVTEKEKIEGTTGNQCVTETLEISEDEIEEEACGYDEELKKFTVLKIKAEVERVDGSGSSSSKMESAEDVAKDDEIPEECEKVDVSY
jgi:hypothetical protein